MGKWLRFKIWLSYYLNLRKHLEKEIYSANVVAMCRDRALYETSRGITETPRSPRIVASMTSYGSRIHTVFMAIQSLFDQTVQADEIVLWLSEEEFSDETLPLSLKRMIPRGLTVRYCKDIRSFKKLIPSLKQYPNDHIITFDDDVYLPHDTIERLWTAHAKHPNVICSIRAHRIALDAQGRLKPYTQWEMDCPETEPTQEICATGVGGVLYPAGIFPDHEVCNEDAFSKLCPTADDLWFLAMAARSNIPRMRIPSGALNRYRVEFPGSQEVSLLQGNVQQGGNDRQLQALMEHYKLSPSCFRKI